MRFFISLLFFIGFPVFSIAQNLNGNWSGFYLSSEHSSQNLEDSGVYSVDSVCVREILKAQEKYDIPNNILLAIGIQESGRKNSAGVLTAWPWTINSYGEGRWFESMEEALSWLKFRQSKGIISNDIGCMQINLKWHPDAFKNEVDGFNPYINVDYAARFLVGLYQKTGDWQKAAGSYHSFTPEKQEIYLKSLERNIRFANIAEDYFLEVALLDNNVNIQNDKTNNLPIWNSWLTNQIGTSLFANQEFEPILPNYRTN